MQNNLFKKEQCNTIGGPVTIIVGMDPAADSGLSGMPLTTYTAVPMGEYETLKAERAELENTLSKILDCFNIDKDGVFISAKNECGGIAFSIHEEHEKIIREAKETLAKYIHPQNPESWPYQEILKREG